MFARGVALCLSLAASSAALGGVEVILRPATGAHPTGESFTVEVFLRQDTTGSDHLLRFVQLDLTATDPLLTVELPTTHDKDTTPVADDVALWVFDTVMACTSDAADCGKGYFIEDELVGVRPNMVSVAYFGDLGTLDIGPNPEFQLNISGSTASELKVGELTVTCLAAADGMTLTLDVINATESDPDLGGEVRWGFAINDPDEPFTPITSFRAGTGLVGGTAAITCGGVDVANLIASAPGCDRSLSRSANNNILLTFDADITAPSAGQLLIQQLQAGGFGSDMSGSFSFTVENDGGGNPRVLRLVEAATVLSHGTWISVRNAGGWAAATNFEVDYRVYVGDVNDDGLVLSQDAGVVTLEVPCFFACDEQLDVNGDGLILSQDAGIVTLNVPFFGAPKPSGHGCVFP